MLFLCHLFFTLIWVNATHVIKRWLLICLVFFMQFCFWWDLLQNVTLKWVALVLCEVPASYISPQRVFMVVLSQTSIIYSLFLICSSDEDVLYSEKWCNTPIWAQLNTFRMILEFWWFKKNLCGEVVSLVLTSQGIL